MNVMFVRDPDFSMPDLPSAVGKFRKAKGKTSDDAPVQQPSVVSKEEPGSVDAEGHPFTAQRKSMFVASLAGGRSETPELGRKASSGSVHIAMAHGLVAQKSVPAAGEKAQAPMEPVEPKKAPVVKKKSPAPAAVPETKSDHSPKIKVSRSGDSLFASASVASLQEKIRKEQSDKLAEEAAARERKTAEERALKAEKEAEEREAARRAKEDEKKRKEEEKREAAERQRLEKERIAREKEFAKGRVTVEEHEKLKAELAATKAAGDADIAQLKERSSGILDKMEKEYKLIVEQLVRELTRTRERLGLLKKDRERDQEVARQFLERVRVAPPKAAAGAATAAGSSPRLARGGGVSGAGVRSPSPTRPRGARPKTPTITTDLKPKAGGEETSPSPKAPAGKPGMRSSGSQGQGLAASKGRLEGSGSKGHLMTASSSRGKLGVSGSKGQLDSSPRVISRAKANLMGRSEKPVDFRTVYEIVRILETDKAELGTSRDAALRKAEEMEREMKDVMSKQKDIDGQMAAVAAEYDAVLQQTETERLSERQALEDKLRHLKQDHAARIEQLQQAQAKRLEQVTTRMASVETELELELKQSGRYLDRESKEYRDIVRTIESLESRNEQANYVAKELDTTIAQKQKLVDKEIAKRKIVEVDLAAAKRGHAETMQELVQMRSLVQQQQQQQQQRGSAAAGDDATSATDKDEAMHDLLDAMETARASSFIEEENTRLRAAAEEDAGEIVHLREQMKLLKQDNLLLNAQMKKMVHQDVE